MTETALALLSSGLDSTLALLMAREVYEIKMALTIDYGQKAAKKERLHAQETCRKLNIEHQLIELSLPYTPKSSLISSESEIPHLNINELESSEKTQASAKSVWVPNRNGLFLHYAAAYCEAHEIQNIIVGFNIEEAQTFPDNSLKFIETINESLKYSTQNHVKVISPTIEMNKSQMVQELLKKDFPMQQLWSCYHSTEKMCGLCEPCIRLKRALRDNHVTNSNLFLQ